jgi:hypothetical protein
MNMPRAVAAAVVALATLIHALPSAAQNGDTVSLTKVVQFSIPNSPAFDFIGESPDQVTRPISPKALTTALLSGLTSAGKFQQGVAIEIAPWQLLSPHMDIREYQSAKGFLLSNSSMSIGTVKASGDTTSTNLGLGARMVLVDRTDPSGPASRVAGDAAMRRLLLVCLPPGPVKPTELAKVKACIAREDSAFHASWRASHWNDYAMSVAAATGWGLRNSVWTDRHNLGAAAWALLAAPLCLQTSDSGLCRKGQWLVKAQYESRDSVTTTRTKQFVGGVRATLGSATFGTFAEYLYRHRSTVPAGAKKSRNDWSLGVEFKMGDETWITSGVGSRYDDLTKSSKAVVLAGFRFNVSPKQQFSTIVPIPKP